MVGHIEVPVAIVAAGCYSVTGTDRYGTVKDISESNHPFCIQTEHVTVFSEKGGRAEALWQGSRDDKGLATVSGGASISAASIGVHQASLTF